MRKPWIAAALLFLFFCLRYRRLMRIKDKEGALFSQFSPSTCHMIRDSTFLRTAHSWLVYIFGTHFPPTHTSPPAHACTFLHPHHTSRLFIRTLCLQPASFMGSRRTSSLHSHHPFSLHTHHTSSLHHRWHRSSPHLTLLRISLRSSPAYDYARCLVL